MNKKILTLSCLTTLSLGLLSSCNNNDNKYYVVMSLLTKSCSNTAEVLENSLVCVESNESKMPFDSGMSVNIYKNHSDSEKEKIATDYINQSAFISAIFDRHNSYKYRNGLDDKFKNLYNLKSFNDDIKDLFSKSETVKKIIFDNVELYNGIKIARDFSIKSNMKYNLTIGALSDLYNQYIENAQKNLIANQFWVVMGEDFSEKELQDAKDAVLSKKELEDMFEFNDNEKSITIKKIRGYENGIYPSITLSGFAKGYAEELFKTKYSNLPFLINGGSSSIMTNKVKTGKEPWRIRINNPIAYEELALFNSPGMGGLILSNVNESEIYYKKLGDFVISTSGYYNNYYYSEKEDGDYVLRHHIIDSTTGKSMSYFDSISVLIEDAAYGDMYSTALMNCETLDEAENLRKELDKNYNFNTKAIYMTHTKLNKNTTSREEIKNNVIVYVPNIIKGNILKIDDLTYPSITKIEYFD